MVIQTTPDDAEVFQQDVYVASSVLGVEASLSVLWSGGDVLQVDDADFLQNEEVRELLHLTAPTPEPLEGALQCAGAVAGGVAACGASIAAVAGCSGFTGGLCAPLMGQVASATCFSAGVAIYCNCNDDVDC